MIYLRKLKNSMKTLLIDIGSTNIKYEIKESRSFSSTPFPMPIRSDSIYYEVDPLAIYNTIKNIIDSIEPDRVYFSCQMHGYVLMNNGVEVSPYVSWRDKRGSLKMPNFRLFPEYGVNIKDNLPRLSIELFDGVFDEFMTLGSYITYKLTGVNASHITDIAPSGFLNILTMHYDDEPFRLPIVYKDVECVGNYNGSKVYTPIGDQQLSILGSTHDSGFDGYILNLGTAAQVCTVSKEFVSGDYESRPYFNNQFLLTVTGIPGGAYVIKNEDNPNLEETLYNVYKESIEKLPKRNKITATGGLLERKKDMIERIFKKIGIPYEFYESKDALHGLEIISNEEDLK